MSFVLKCDYNSSAITHTWLQWFIS